MKKLINRPDQVLPQMLEGLAMTTPGVAVLDDAVAVRSDLDAWQRTGQVALVSGGGSGHEPAHAGYVGPGMLTAAVCGDVFSSPSVDAVLAAVRAVGGAAGVLLLVKNYTGDRLNFGLAAEIARGEGIPVEMVVIGDDAAMDASGDHAGRRGLAGTVLVHKIAGAAAAAGLPLPDVAREAATAARSVSTMGVALTPCTVPAAGRPGLELGPTEIEWGLGIHGERGIERGTLVPSDDVVDRLLGRILADLGTSGGDRVALLVNNLGGTPAMELSIVARRAVTVLAERGVRLERVWVGAFLTALEMAGCSLSVLRVDDGVLARLDAPTRTAAWPADHVGGLPADGPARLRSPAGAAAEERPPLAADSPVRRALAAVCAALIDAEGALTELDQQVGDGDLGINLARGARAVQAELAGYDGTSPSAALRGVAGTVRRVVGGTSGPLCAALLLRTASTLAEDEAPSARAWAQAFADGVGALGELGGAGVGDRTMIDALQPAAEALRAALDDGSPGAEALARAVEAGERAARATAGIVARRGRSSYLGARVLGVPDPGAVAAMRCLAAIRDAGRSDLAIATS